MGDFVTEICEVYVELYLKSAFRLTKEWPRFKDELDTMKFICTDFWSSINKKQIDNLRTNHQGVYVLQDNAFRFLTWLSAGRQFLEMAPKVISLVKCSDIFC
jgi:Transport protein particle (TRAPP) component.